MVLARWGTTFAAFNVERNSGAAVDALAQAPNASPVVVRPSGAFEARAAAPSMQRRREIAPSRIARGALGK
jgi:hypothetical protein